MLIQSSSSLFEGDCKSTTPVDIDAIAEGIYEAAERWYLENSSRPDLTED